MKQSPQTLIAIEGEAGKERFDRGFLLLENIDSGFFNEIGIPTYGIMPNLSISSSGRSYPYFKDEVASL